MRIAFLSVFAFDANISLIKSLRHEHEVYFITEALHEIYNYLDVKKLAKKITVGTDVEQLKKFSSYIDLEKTYVVKGVRNVNFVRKMSNSFAVQKLLNKIEADVIILDNISITYIVPALINRRKSLLIVHDPFPHSGEHTLYQSFLKKIYFHKIRNKVLLNKSQRDEFVNHYKLDTNDIGASFLSTYEFLKAFLEKSAIVKVHPQPFNVLFFGRISPYKGIKNLLDAFVRVSEKYGVNALSLTIAGSGNFDFDIKQYDVSNIKFINRFIGFEELADLVDRSSIVVCPYTDATQSGVVMSAFAFKKPVIATNVGGLPEMVQNQTTGIVVEPQNVSELTDAIILLYENPDLLKKMSDNIDNLYLKGAKSWDNAANLLSQEISKVYERNRNHK